MTLAELLTQHTPGWQPPPLHRRVLAQVHCHQHAVMGWDADGKLLAAAGRRTSSTWNRAAAGWPGTSASSRGHSLVSEACAERVLLPRLREAPSDAVVLADGFSCRTQIHELDSGGRDAMHLSELLAAGGTLPQDYAERSCAPRPAPPTVGVKLLTLAAAAGASALAAAVVIRGRRR